MAQMLPDMPPGRLDAAALKIHRLLKRLPDQHYEVWQRLSIWPEPGPDFWVKRKGDERAALIKVSSATRDDARSALQFDLFQAGALHEPVGRTEQDALRRFAESAAGNAADALLFLQQVPAVIAFPNISSPDLDRIAPRDLPPGIAWVGKEEMAPNRFESWLERRLGPPLAAETTSALRKAFTPEVVIPPSFTVRQPIERNTEAQLTDYLLDDAQERALKSDLDLSTEARAALDDFGLRLVNGVAGSGKSLIIVYRARLLRRLYPDKPMLVLTHNRALIRDLRSRYHQLSSNGRGTEWLTFLGWCRKYWPSSPAWHEPIRSKRRDEAIRLAWYAHLRDTAVSERMLQDEIDWHKDRLLLSREDYLNADRAGRGFALNEPMRQRVFDAIEAYQRDLDAHRQVDWGDVPRRMWQFIIKRRVKLPVYDVVLVDEAQFFAPIWFEIVKKMLKPAAGHLFLAADPTQGFLKRRQSWLASGLEVRGRSHKLEKSYRTTREILSAATLLYRTQLPDDDEEDIVAPDLLDMPSGSLPIIVPLTSEQDEMARAVNEIRQLVAAGTPLGDILVIHADWQGAKRIMERLQQEIGPAAAANPQDTLKGNHVRVCALDAVTGLESPIVFIVGAHALYEREQSVRLSDEERAELIRDNTRRLYMAITRAGQRLVITYVGELPEALKRLSAQAQ